MDDKKKEEITQISKDFFSGFAGTFDKIEGTGWLIADPLSGYLNFIGFKNSLTQIPASDKAPQVLILCFPDESQFIPAGSDLKHLHPDAKNWMWL